MSEDGSGTQVSSLPVIPGEHLLLELKYKERSLVRRHNCKVTLTNTTQCLNKKHTFQVHVKFKPRFNYLSTVQF